MVDSYDAKRLADIALGHVEREFPNHIVHWLDEPADAQRPSALHPIFFGSFDWHSCVHSYWLLARLVADGTLGSQTDEAIAALFARRITSEAVAGELTYFQRGGGAGFERPYGWAWLAKLSAELVDHRHPSLRAAGDTLEPLVQHVVALWIAYWPKQTYPIRAGVHSNSAFATTLGLDYAAARQDQQLQAVLTDQAVHWYGNDQDYPAWEPGGDEFLSPALIEALAMQRVLSPEAFRDWFDVYLPRLADAAPACLFEPAIVSDRADGKLAHLDGLNLSRAWCWQQLASALSAGDARIALMRDAATVHRQIGLQHLETDYMGSHWLASFARLARPA